MLAVLLLACKLQHNISYDLVNAICQRCFRVIFVESESQVLRVRVKSESSKIFSSRVRVMGRKTDAFTWPSLLRYFLKSLPNLLPWEQPLLLALDMFIVEWSNNALLRARQQKCCRRWPTTHYTPAEHRGAHWQQDLRRCAASLQEQESWLSGVESESSHRNYRVTSSHWFASSSQCRVTRNFTFFHDIFCYEMVPNTL